MKKQPGRLFTFGCSVTSYFWPTWADILGQQWDYFENWAEMGAGNNFIFNSIVECDARNHFTPDDVILVMWSGIARIDFYQDKWRYIQNQWHKIHDPDPVFEQQKSDLPFSSPIGYEILNYPLFVAAEKYLDSKKCNYQFSNWMSYPRKSKPGLLYRDTLNRIKFIRYDWIPKNTSKFLYNNEIFNLYEKLKGKDWPSLNQILHQNDSIKNLEIKKEIEQFLYHVEGYKTLLSTHTKDLHPFPIEHLQISKQIMPNIQIDDSTIDWITDINEKIKTNQYFVFDQHKPLERL